MIESVSSPDVLSFRKRWSNPRLNMPKPVFLFRTVHLVIFVHGTSSHWNWLYDAGLGLGLGQPVFTHPAPMPKASHMPRTPCSTVYILVLLNYQLFVPPLIAQSHRPLQYKQNPYKVIQNESLQIIWSSDMSDLRVDLMDKVDYILYLLGNII